MKAFALVFSCAISVQAATGALPVPTDESQAAALKIAKEIYGKQYAEAKGSEQKKALAESFLQRAAEAWDDPPSHFVLLRLSRDVAALAGEAGLAQRAIEAMALTFDIDITPMKIETLLQTASRATSPEQHAEVVEFAEKLRDDAVETDDFAAATRLAEAALAAAKKTGDRALIRKVQERTDEVSELAQAFVRLQQAAATLRNQPDDPVANLALGKYLCLQKGQWERGLPMLSLGDDPQLRELAVAELVPFPVSNFPS